MTTTQFDSRHSLKFISRYIKSKATLLDIGCGNGIFLDEADKHKFVVSGIDMSSTLVKFLRQKFNFPVYHGDIISAKINNKYDIVTLNQVIEHFSRPRTLIRKCYKLLNHNGFIYIATPNIASLASKIRREKFDYIIPPEHLSYFNASTLTRILILEGFKVLRIGYWSYSVDLAGLIKHFFKRDNKNLKKATMTFQHRYIDIKVIKYLLFDQIICRLLYKVLNINHGGTMIEVLAQKI